MFRIFVVDASEPAVIEMVCQTICEECEAGSPWRIAFEPPSRLTFIVPPGPIADALATLLYEMGIIYHLEDVTWQEPLPVVEVVVRPGRRPRSKHVHPKTIAPPVAPGKGVDNAETE